MLHKRKAKGAASLSAMLAVVRAQGSGQPLNMVTNMSSGGLGPDGPWNYWTLNIGSGPQSPVDFFPVFGVPTSLIVTQDSCSKGNKLCLFPTPNYYDQASSSAMASGFNKSLVSIDTWNAWAADQNNLNGGGYYFADTVNEPVNAQNLSMLVADNLTASLGNEPYIPVSLLSLEPSIADGSRDGAGNPIPGTTLLGDYASSAGTSQTVSLHMGSAAFNQAGSICLSGYDQNRIIENPALFTQTGTVPLKSISFGHASGLDPWANTANVPANFLQGPLNVLLSPQTPNLNLPQDVCALLSHSLPIYPDHSTNLYLWNTSDPAYEAIVGSPSYLNFTFGDQGSTAIKVPFALLNLTLSNPAKPNPVQYFPCDPRNDTINLGRAFLQAAVVMQSYDPSRIFIGQAPGPSVNQSLATNIKSIDGDNPDMVPASNPPRWNDTWAEFLKPLTSPAPVITGAASSSATPVNSGTSGGLSGGAIAGIVIGVLAVAALLVGAAFLLFRHSRRQRQQRQQKALFAGQYHGEKPWYPAAAMVGSPHVNKGYFGPPQEMDSMPRLHEADSNERQGMLRAELDGAIPAAEMGDTHTQR